MMFRYSVAIYAVALGLYATNATAQSLPLGRLSASSAPVPTVDVVASSALHYTDGETDAQLSTSSLAANTSYDVYDLLTQSVSIATAPFGSSVVHGGKRVNGTAFTGCAQYACIYLGAVITDASGKINQQISYGQNRRWDVWNFYNQIDVRLQVGEPATGSNIWVNCTSTLCPQYPAFSALNGHTANNGTVFTGLSTLVEVDFHESGFVNSTSGPTALIAAIGWDTATVGNCGYYRVNSHDDTYAEQGVGGEAFCLQRNVVGPHTVTMLIAAANGLGSTFAGGYIPNAWGGQQMQPDISSVMWIKYKG